ncbi:MAG: helix-hairpin-helix domain-containing protein, partial [Chloroflexota bacterium]|nr:helix-hairpin-helix domain-containing protein [Chloroflexota bacterium]
FTTQEQLRLFELLISVTGVGPGVALAVLSAGSPDDIESAIASENVSFFSGVPRMGPKLAARVVLELKKKVRQLEPAGFSGGPVISGGDDVMLALLGLGYSAGEAQAAARHAASEPGLSTEERILRALAYFNRA